MIAWRIFAMVHLAMHDALNGIAPDEIGYAHAANFTIAFTKAFGISPLQYRTGRRDVDRITM
jgi:YesN/AraC family two-component response regulator